MRAALTQFFTTLAQVGANEIEAAPPLPAWLRLWRCYLNPFNLLLTALAALSWFGADAKATIVIGVMVINTATVRRQQVDGTPSTARRDIPQRELVPGDLVTLSAGDMIPADCRAVSSNLLYDFSRTGIPFDNVDPELVAKPLKWNPADIGRFMLFFGPISSIFDIATFALMWKVFHANSLGTQTLFQSGWSVVGLLTQTLVVHMIRTPNHPEFRGFLKEEAARMGYL